ncbi:hypothetical protein HDV00_001550 [Rhizophlyctis rosea]|nr:hypothetical protein HDV00_001550 [Rhizophlyctis rosea]
MCKKMQALNVAASLLRIMRSEGDLVASLTSLGIASKDAIDILSVDPTQRAASDVPWGTTFDTRSDAILWWNDLEKDARYQRWPPMVHEIMRPAMPGSMKYFKKNAFNTVFFLDLTNELHLLTMQMLFQFISQSVPLRIGVVPLYKEDDEGNASTIAAQCFYKLIETGGRKPAKQFLDALAEKRQKEEITPAIVEAAYDGIAQRLTPTPESAWKKDDYFMSEAGALFRRLGIRHTDDVFFINGKQLELVENWQRSMLGVYFPMLEHLAVKIYANEIKEKTNMESYFFSMPNVYPRRNALIFGSEPKIVDVTRSTQPDFVDRISWWSADARSVAITSILVIADFTTLEGLKLARNGLEYVANANSTRIAFLHNPVEDKPVSGKEVLLHEVDVREGSENDNPVQSLLAAAEYAIAAGRIGLEGVTSQDKRKHVALTQSGRAFISDVFGLKHGESGIAVNGRIVGPIASSDTFEADDVKLLASIEAEERYDGIAKKILKLTPGGIDSLRLSNLIYKASSIVVAAAAEAAAAAEEGKEPPVRISSAVFETLERKYCQLIVGNAEAATFQFTAHVDPVTDVAQKLSALLKVVSKMDGVYINVIFNPTSDAEEKPPLARFYRYVLESEPKFSADGSMINPVAEFHDIPTDPLLTLGTDVPGAWLVFPERSVHDLDNIRLSSLKGEAKRIGVKAEFVLENILVEGHARDTKTNGPPRGLQFTLGTEREPVMVDTITMANLGYVQLKANPGVWDLRLRSGRSRDLYDIQAVEDSHRRLRRNKIDNKLIGDEGAKIAVTSFEGVTIFPLVKKKPGKENEQLIEEEGPKAPGESGGIWNKVKGSLFKSHPKKKNVINVFSVASGHLYERFLSIMMLSVRKHTKSDVKFWLIENFLSPSFMGFLPHLAKEYGFKYEFVTYKWPHWLRAQTEKQRIIWGYKILFLDVLFPLDVDRVIFVDADQVVRTDLQELVDMDLKGAVYGYTPFCDDRKEMDGFRFWKQGYWSNHLAGMPYHISALYVVDLVRFRQVAAGDRIRQQYHMLSADPHSLANLDQDLPNNMQHTLPIFSLPQEWLWCETWCSDESLKKAKTIDLCNNPLTKEPKLERAKRILPEWEGLDAEVAAVAKPLEKSGKKPDQKQGKLKQDRHTEKDEL